MLQRSGENINSVAEHKQIPKINLEVVTGEKDFEEEIINEQQRASEEKFKNTILAQDIIYPDPIPVLSIVQNNNTVPFFTLNSFSLAQGKMKSKKTIVLALIAAAFINPECVSGIIYFIIQAIGTVLIFDTEQGRSYAARTMRLILKIAGLEKSPNLIYCDLREYSPTERMQIIEAAIRCTPNVRFVIIDGIVDLMEDFMDAKEGHSVVTTILKWCSIYNVHICGVLHQNKNDKNARAHIGTISSQKCEMEISTEVDSEDRTKSIVTCVNSRGLPFEPFAIQWEKGSLPNICQDYNISSLKEIKENKKSESWEILARKAFKKVVCLSHSNLVKELMLVSNKSESTAKKYVKDLDVRKIIEHREDGNYYLLID